MRTFFLVAFLFIAQPFLFAADWPMWRYDANRSAASPQELPAKLALQWSRSYPPQNPAWRDQTLMTFDTSYQPVVIGHTLLFGSTRTDALTALDTRTGDELWRFYANGPIRFAPVAWQGNVYVASDDGYLYCLSLVDGSIVWKFRGGPGDRLLLGNERLISTWPARGAPVIASDGTLYFAASIWPFMGVFLHALDARTGRVIWTNDSDGSTYMKQPHNADSFAGVAPQGPLVVSGDCLLVAGGRSVPACYDRHTGKLLYYLLAENSKKGGGSELAAIGSVFFNGGSAFTLDKGKYLGAFANFPVLTNDTIYAFQKDLCRAFDLKNAEVFPPKWKIAETGAIDAKDGSALIKSGQRLYIGAPKRVWSVALPLPKSGTPKPTWEVAVAGTPLSLVAADDRLFVVTQEGQFLCFGGEVVKSKIHPPLNNPTQKEAVPQVVKDFLQSTTARNGYCICWGTGDGKALKSLAEQTKFHLIAIEKDPAKVYNARKLLAAANLYGDRVAVIQADPKTVQLPPYLAVAMFTENWDEAALGSAGEFLPKAFHSLRPFGGSAYLPVAASRKAKLLAEASALKLTNGTLVENADGIVVTKVGALPETDNWTHEHADAQNTRVSMDSLVKAPLGMLWFGGPTNDGILPRHGHGPQPQVIDGRLIIEGVDLIRALDIYTGRLLWQTSLPGVGAFFDNTAHQPGANASGTNFISTSDAIYVAYQTGCTILDPATGKIIGEYKLPFDQVRKTQPRWGYINVIDDYLIGGADPLWDPTYDLAKIKPKDPNASDEDLKSKIKSAVTSLKLGENDNNSASKNLVVMNRKTGEVLWSANARFAFRHNGICAGNGRVYAIDRLSSMQIKKLTRDKLLPPEKPRVVAFDLKTGRVIWEKEDDVFGTWLSYSEKHDVLVESGRVARDTLYDEPKGMRGRNGSTGIELWLNKTYLGPAMIHGETILKDQSACELLTGKPKMRLDPLTGEAEEWKWIRNYGCNTPMASQNLMTFRSGAAGYLDLCNDGGTGNFGGFRSSCTNNLIVAGGVLCAPDYTRTCSCSYQNQTSVGLVHSPEVEMWTSFGRVGGDGPIRHVGVNFGAPGDRKADDGTLWLESPSVGGFSPPIKVTVTGTKVEYFRSHQSRIEGPMNWVAASGVKGMESITIALGDEDSRERAYTIRLHFAELAEVKPGDRVFDVAVQGKVLLPALDVVREAGGVNKGLVKELKGIKVVDDLQLKFTASSADKPAILSGIEIVAEGW